LSKAVFDSLEKFDKLDAEGQQREIVGVISRVSPLGDGDDKDYLVAAITDSFKNAAGALERKEEVGKIIDGLYAKCKEADEKAAQAVVDSILGKDNGKDSDKDKDSDKEKDKEKDDEKSTKDAASVEDIVAKALSGVADSVVAGIKDSLPAMVEKTVKDALGLTGGKDDSEKRVDDSLDEEFDPSFLLDGVFGSN
jgi:NADH dehydrogenase/NADH:ubiquinone oxidoreductase subunit G